MPFVGFRGMDLFNVSQQLAEQAIKQPPLVLKHYTDFLLEMGRVMTGQSTIEPVASDKRFTDEAWKTNPFYHALLFHDGHLGLGTSAQELAQVFDQFLSAPSPP